MSETKINASQTTITAEDIGALSAFDTMPTAAVGYLNKIVQYVGTTDTTYTNGYFYKCVSDGAVTPTYSWERTDVQPSSGGLPSQTGNAGKFLTTDGTDASWSDKPIINKNTASIYGISILSSGLPETTQYSVHIGTNVGSMGSNTVAIGYASAANTRSIAIGSGAEAIGGTGLQDHSIAIGLSAKTTAKGAIQLGGNRTNVTATNSDADTFKVANTNGNFEILSADGTIPTDRFTTTPVADGTYVPTLSISSGVATRSWTTPASAPVVPATMPTLAVNDWSSNTQTVNVTGVTASNIVFVSPAPASASDYASAGIVCTAQGAGTLTFTCTTTPTNAITVNVVILG